LTGGGEVAVLGEPADQLRKFLGRGGFFGLNGGGERRPKPAEKTSERQKREEGEMDLRNEPRSLRGCSVGSVVARETWAGGWIAGCVMGGLRRE
jgi:hypothetical protein